MIRPWRTPAGDMFRSLAGDNGSEAFWRAQRHLKADLTGHGSAEEDGFFVKAPDIKEVQNQFGIKVRIQRPGPRFGGGCGTAVSRQIEGRYSIACFRKPRMRHESMELP